MARYVEEEFGRLLPESSPEDLDMQDAADSGETFSTVAQPNGSVQDWRNNVVSPDGSQSQPIPSIEEQSEVEVHAKFIIAIDFGTTFSSVAFVRVEPGTSARLLGSESIRCIDNYPGMPSGGSATVLASNPTVPTELLYTLQRGKSSSFGGTLRSESSAYESDCSLDEEWASNDSEGDEHTSPPQDAQAQVSRSRDPLSRNPLWGWAVHTALIESNIIPDEVKHLKNFKLQLDESSTTKELRNRSKEDLKSLKALKVVDVIADYLTRLLKHAKERLTTSHGLRHDSPVEFVLCVPNSWTDKACRDMQKALTLAVQASQIAKLENEAIQDLFIVAEPEAAAAFALDDAESTIQLVDLESFLILDCGGGTVDAITYTLTQATPPRLQEAVKPEGRSCGSSFLNESFRKYLEQRLKPAKIVGNDSSLENIIAAKVQEFENEKRKINILDKKAGFDAIRIPGLQADREHGFLKGRFEMTWKEMYNVFHDLIREVADLMRKQLTAAKEQGVNVQTVIVIGGFGQSPSLQNHLKKALRRELNLLNQSIDLECPRHIESTVARGAVLRALRKEDGPERMTRSSYGILRTDRYNEQDPKHRRFRTWRDPADGELYITRTIHWILNKDTLVPPRQEIPIRSRHIFKVNAPKFLCVEILYVSSGLHPSGYKVSHRMNKGAEEAGQIIADMTFLKTENRIKPVTEENAEGKSYSYYEIEYDLWIVIEARTLKFEARSPINPQEVTASRQFCIAAAFVPGTA